MEKKDSKKRDRIGWYIGKEEEWKKKRKCLAYYQEGRKCLGPGLYVVVRPSEMKSYCNIIYFAYAKPKRNKFAKCHCFSNGFENILIHDTMLSAIFRKSACFRSRRYPKPRISTVFRRAQKNASKISRRSTKNRMTKRMGFYKMRSEVC